MVGASLTGFPGRNGPMNGPTLDELIKEAATRRDVFKKVGATALAGALIAQTGFDPALAQELASSSKPLKAAFSNAGLQATWCAQGKQAAEAWGKLMNVEVTWFDGQLDAVKQRAASTTWPRRDGTSSPSRLLASARW